MRAVRRALVIFRKEIRDTVRDRRTLLVMVLVPILLMPLVLVGSVKLQEMATRSQAEDVVQLLLSGGENAPGLVAVLADNRAIELVQDPRDPVELLKDGDVDAHLAIPDDFMESVEAETTVLLDLEINSTHGNSAAAVDKVRLALDAYSKGLVEARLEETGVSPSVLNGVEADPQDTATEKEKGGTFLGYLLPMFLVIFAMIGGMYTAMDISAGEKERKTLEALLMTPASRNQIVSGKFLAVATVSIITIVLSVAAIFFTAPLISGSMGEVDLTLDARAALVMVPVAVLLASMFAALLLAVSIFARSYKEAQNYVTPLYLLAVLPVIVANALPAGNDPLLFVIPGFNAVLLFREVLLEQYAASHITLTVASSIFYTLLSVRYAARIYSREDVLVDEGGGPRRAFARRRL